jgi:DNA invertase Pin-like site-specific DNA recombinase
MTKSEQVFMEQIQKALSRYYRQMLSRNIKRGIAAKRAKKLPTA